MHWLKKFLFPYFQSKNRLRFYPPFWLMRLKIVQLDPQWRKVRIILPLTRISKNPGGGMFGGFQACLADPIAALACVKAFPGCEVWTRNLQLDFYREGRSDLELRFDFSDQKLLEIEEEMQKKGRSNPVFEYGFYDPGGHLCTRITCRVAIRPEGYIPKTRSLNKAA